MIDVAWGPPPGWYPGKLTERERRRAVIPEMLRLRMIRRDVARFARTPYRIYRRSWLVLRLAVKGWFR